VCSGIAFQQAHCVVLLKYLTAASIFSSVLSGTFRESFLLAKCWKASQFVYLLLKYSCFSWSCACVVSVMIAADWSDERSKYYLAIAKFWVIPFVTQKSTRSGSLFKSDGQYVGSQVERCDR
jgi:hypothetical protein